MWIDSTTRMGGREGRKMTINLNINRHTHAFSIWWKGKPVLSLAHETAHLPLGPGYKRLGPFGYAFTWSK